MEPNPGHAGFQRVGHREPQGEADRATITLASLVHVTALIISCSIAGVPFDPWRSGLTCLSSMCWNGM